MVLTNSVLRRRYTPPTCTLQIVARSSPLSRWVGGAADKLIFELRFDDPRLPEEKQIHIQGDQGGLQALHEAVTVYTQNLINQSPERFNAILSILAPPQQSDGAVSSTPQVPYDSQALFAKPQSLGFSEHSTYLEEPVIVPENTTAGLFGKIFLQPGRGLSHKLFLGSLATEETGPVIQLSVLQLFDLVTALDEYAADALTLPALNRPSSAASPAWASIAAVILVGVGLTTVVLLLNRSNPQQQIANRSYTQRSSNNPQQPIALQPSPLAPLPVPTPPLSSPEPLPTLPNLGSIGSPSANSPLETGPGTLPLDSSPRANTRAPKPTPPIFNTAPKQESIDSLLRAANGSRTNGPTTLNVPVPPPVATLPSPAQLNPPKRDVNAALPGVDLHTAPPSNPSSGTPTQQIPPSATVPYTLGIPTPQGAGKTSTPSASQRLTQALAPGSPTSNAPKSSTLFDITPQVAEVRQYFKQHWNPPSGLNEPLQYSILLDIDGSIQRIIPLGQASINYVDRSGMPVLGRSFVSPNKSGQTPRIRVVLFPNGKVQAFPELSNQ